MPNRLVRGGAKRFLEFCRTVPEIVFALIFNLASGLVGRVMPQFQIFFAAAPLSVILGLSVFALSLGVLGTVFIDRYRAMARVFAAGAGGSLG